MLLYNDGSNYDQVAVNGVNSSTIQKVVSRKWKKYIQKHAEERYNRNKNEGNEKDEKKEIMYRCADICIDDFGKRMFCFDFFGNE